MNRRQAKKIWRWALFWPRGRVQHSRHQTGAAFTLLRHLVYRQARNASNRRGKWDPELAAGTTIWKRFQRRGPVS